MRLIQAVLAVALVLVPGVGVAQENDSWDAGRPLASRVELGRLYRELLWTADSSAYSEAMRALAQRQAMITRARLDSGDFNVGDRVWLAVENEPTLRDTVTVTSGRVIALPDVGVVSLHGVLRSELETHLTQSLGKFLRNPVVHARSFLQLSFLGAVGRPGFYNIPTEVPLTTALGMAGGPSVDSDLPGMYIDRNGQRLWDAHELQQAITLGLTVDQLGLRGGDKITVPRKRSITEGTVRTVTLILAIPLTIYSISQIFHH